MRCDARKGRRRGEVRRRGDAARGRRSKGGGSAGRGGGQAREWGEGDGRALAPTACSSDVTKSAKSLPSPPALTRASAGLRPLGLGHCCRHDGRSASRSDLNAAQSPRPSSSFSRRSRCCLIASTMARISRASRASGMTIMRSSSRYTCNRVCAMRPATWGLQPGACNRARWGVRLLCSSCAAARGAPLIAQVVCAMHMDM